MVERAEKSSTRIRGSTSALQQRARDLRRNMTPAEARLWQALRRRQIHGLHFRRQHPIGPFIVDFYCAERRLIVEVDGAIHDDRFDYDAARSGRLAEFGYRVIRFTNDDVLQRLPVVIDRIEKALGGTTP